MPIKINSTSKKHTADLDISRRSKTDARDRLITTIKATKIEVIPLADITANPRNPRRHSSQQIELIAENIIAFGFTQPILIDERSMILAGHARVAAARSLRLDNIPTVRLASLTPSEKQALAIADNKLAELAEWDIEILTEELSIMFDPASSFDFDPRIIGFETVEIDQLIEAKANHKPDPADRYAGPIQNAVSCTGDIWICNEHRIVCGDALQTETLAALMGEEQANIVFTDPPYNVPNSGHVTKRAGVRDFMQAHGEMSAEAFTQFLSNACRQIARFSRPGTVVYLCIDWRHLAELQSAADNVFGPPKNFIVWVKKNGGLGTFYRSRHEIILPYVVPGAAPTNNFKLGSEGRYRTNVWEYPGLSSFGRNRDQTLDMHPTVKPVALIADALMDCSHRRDVVLDPFGGSGSTMIAAERTGRRARLAEIDPLYCDVAVRRWQTLTGQRAYLAGRKKSFNEASDDNSEICMQKRGPVDE